MRFFDESYQNRNQELQLFVQANQEFIALAYFDASERKFAGIEEYALDACNNWHQLTEILDELFSAPHFKDNFQDVSFSLVSKLYTPVPSALFDPEQKQEYLELNHSELESNVFFKSEEVSALNLQLIYASPSILEKYLDKRFSKYSLHHHMIPFLEDFALGKKADDEELRLHIQKDHFDILYFSESKVQYLNSFHYQTVEDFIYYLLYVMEQLKIDRDKTPLKLFGEFELKSNLYDTIFKYVRHPQIIDRSKSVNYSKPLDQVKSHQYLNLFNQYLCG